MPFPFQDKKGNLFGKFGNIAAVKGLYLVFGYIYNIKQVKIFGKLMVYQPENFVLHRHFQLKGRSTPGKLNRLLSQGKDFIKLLYKFYVQLFFLGLAQQEVGGFGCNIH